MSSSLVPDRVSPVPQDIFDDTYGGSLICCMIMLVLYGLAVLQTYMYFINYGGDSFAMKALVGVVWSMATVHAVFVCHTVYHYTILTYSNPLALIDGEWSVYAATCIGVILCFFIQMFFARMLFLLTRQKWRWIVTSTLGAFILGQVGYGIYTSYRLYSIWVLPDLYQMVYDAMVPLFVIRVLSDTVTAVALCVILFDSRTAFARSLRLIKTLMIYAMERFVLTTLVVFVQTIILIAKPKSIWAMVIEFVTAQLYTNSFLATLNSRNHLRDIGSGDSEYVSVSGFRSKIEIKRSIQISTNSTGSGVKIGTETLVMSDIVDDKRLSGWSPDV